MHTIKDQQIKRLQAARHGLAEEFRAHGIKPARDLDFFASELPDEEALYGLWRHMQEFAVRRIDYATEAYDALNDVIIARENYDLEARRRPSRQIRLARDLMVFARKQTTCEILSLLDRRLADPQRGPPVLAALCKGGVAAGLARDTDEVGRPNLSVKIAGKWTRVRGDMEEGLRCLADDPVAFAVAARKALDLENKFSPPDRLRPLRDLIDCPTRRRYEALLKKGVDGSDNDLAIYLPVLRQGARRLFGGNLPMTWCTQVAADPELIKAVAQSVLELLKTRITASGPPRDPAQDAYVTRLCEIYQGLTGEVVSYSTAWPSNRSRPEGSRFGPALTCLQLGLRLIDPGASEHQARECIDWYSARVRKNSRRDLRA